MNEIFQLSAMKKYHIQFPYMLKNKTFENYYTKKPSWRKKKNEPWRSNESFVTLKDKYAR